jgi:acetoin utilization protein AcuB
MLIRNVMTENPDAVSPNSTLGEAYELMRNRKFDCLPVMDKARNLVGIIQVTDIYEACMHLGRQGALPKPVGEFMVTPVVTIGLDEPVEKAAALMLKRDIPAIPVVEDEKLVGMVTEHEIFRTTSTMLGAESGTTRITIVVPETKGQLAKIAELVRDAGLSLTNVATFHSSVLDQFQIVLRLHADVIEPLLDALERAGFKVLHTCID